MDKSGALGKLARSKKMSSRRQRMDSLPLAVPPRAEPPEPPRGLRRCPRRRRGLCPRLALSGGGGGSSRVNLADDLLWSPDRPQVWAAQRLPERSPSLALRGEEDRRTAQGCPAMAPSALLPCDFDVPSRPEVHPRTCGQIESDPGAALV